MKTAYFSHDNDAHRGWILALLNEWERLQRDCAQLQQLRPPNLVINDHIHTTLGHWDENTRCITLSSTLFNRADWHTVVAVFKHEIAHQIVSELFGIRNAQPHGEAFGRACSILGISAARTMAIDTDGRSSTSKIVARVHKLLALGTSPNPHEAEQALAKAHELILRHNITLQNGAPLDNYTFRLVGAPMKRVPSHIWSVAGLVSEFYFVRYIGNRYRGNHPDFQNAYYTQIEFYGTPENLNIAEYVFYFLLNQGDQQWQQYHMQHRLRNNRHKRSFLNGIYDGVRTSLERRHRRLTDEKALVWMGDPRLDAFYRQRNPHIQSRQVRTQLDATAHANGVEIGSKLQISPGVTSSSTNTPQAPRQLYQ